MKWNTNNHWQSHARAHFSSSARREHILCWFCKIPIIGTLRTMKSPAPLLAAALLLTSASAFAPPSSQISASTAARSPTSTTQIAADVSAGEIAKSIGIPLLFGGGLIPAAIIANKSMVSTLMKKRPEKPNLTEEEKKTYLDPTFGQGM